MIGGDAGLHDDLQQNLLRKTNMTDMNISAISI